MPDVPVDPRGEARRDGEIAVALANRLGRGRYFPYRSALDIWEELRVASKGGVAGHSGITWEKIDRQGDVFWPCTSENDPGSPASRCRCSC
jgi:assimilatory nitrate reductase catalytic subunit